MKERTYAQRVKWLAARFDRQEQLDPLERWKLFRQMETVPCLKDFAREATVELLVAVDLRTLLRDFPLEGKIPKN